MSSAGSVVADRVAQIAAAALRRDPARWWDAEELAAEVQQRAPGLSADPLPHVRAVLRAWRATGAVQEAREVRIGVRARERGTRRRGPPVVVVRHVAGG